MGAACSVAPGGFANNFGIRGGGGIVDVVTTGCDVGWLKIFSGAGAVTLEGAGSLGFAV